MYHRSCRCLRDLDVLQVTKDKIIPLLSPRAAEVNPLYPDASSPNSRQTRDSSLDALKMDDANLKRHSKAWRRRLAP